MMMACIGLLFFLSLHASSTFEDIQRAVVMQPHNVDLLQQLAQLYAQDKRYTDASAYYQLAAHEISSPEKKAELLANKGACLAHEQHWQEALNAYEESITHDAQQPKALHNIPILKELLRQQEQSKKEDSRKQPKKNDTDTDENKGSHDQGADKEPGEQQAQQGNQEERNDENKQTAEKKADHGKKDNVQHEPQPKEKSRSSNGDKQEEGSQQQVGNNKDRPLPSSQEKLQQESQPASSIKDVQKKLHEAQTQREQKQLDAREKIGDQAWRWLSQIEEHERQGQQVLVEYQSKQVQQEHGSKNW